MMYKLITTNYKLINIINIKYEDDIYGHRHN